MPLMSNSVSLDLFGRLSSHVGGRLIGDADFLFFFQSMCQYCRFYFVLTRYNCGNVFFGEKKKNERIL